MGSTGAKKAGGGIGALTGATPSAETETESKVNPKPTSDDDLEELAKYPTKDANDLEGVTDFSDSGWSGTDKWFANPKLSNYTEWKDGLTGAQMDAIEDYTGSGYSDLNAALYGTNWDDMSDSAKKTASNLYEAINNFELNKAIHVARGAELRQTLGFAYGEVDFYNPEKAVQQIKNKLAETGGVYQYNGFQSTSTGSYPAFGGGKGLIIHYTIPPSKGAGAYLRPLSMHSGEREFTLNTNAVVRFDPNSVVYKGGTYHINAEWLGQAKDQKFKKKK